MRLQASRKLRATMRLLERLSSRKPEVDLSPLFMVRGQGVVSPCVASDNPLTVLLCRHLVVANYEPLLLEQLKGLARGSSFVPQLPEEVA